jgi:hypothetical protein
VLGGNGGAGCEVRNGASDTQRAVNRARREQQAGERMPRESAAHGAQLLGERKFTGKFVAGERINGELPAGR